MPWLKEVNPVIDWTSQDVTIGNTRIHSGGPNSELMVLDPASGCCAAWSTYSNRGMSEKVSQIELSESRDSSRDRRASHAHATATSNSLDPRGVTMDLRVDPAPSESCSACFRTPSMSNQTYLHRNPFAPLSLAEVSSCAAASHLAAVAEPVDPRGWEKDPGLHEHPRVTPRVCRNRIRIESGPLGTNRGQTAGICEQ